ncbi:hypothetical protein [Streptomyces xanthophaeus]|uniref:hypothetical protein n=1 Tax=Streptomyces xanthophaeus TaxID=67385 RepID=UPI00233EF818|nr:hypothetical protein [Streptomyces xanthophaeus]
MPWASRRSRRSHSGSATRYPHPTDRRAKQLVLPAEGTALRGRLLDLLGVDSPLSGLDPQEQRVLRGLLEQALTSP